MPVQLRCYGQLTDVATTAVAIELFGLTAAEMADRFDRNTLANNIQTVIPLEPATGRRLAIALALAGTPP